MRRVVYPSSTRSKSSAIDCCCADYPRSHSAADKLREDLRIRGVHPRSPGVLLREVIADNYLHAGYRGATKSVADKFGRLTSLTGDGSILVDRSLAGDPPLLAINPLSAESHRSEQRGFANLVRGTFGMFRNISADEATILWTMHREDAQDLLCLHLRWARDTPQLMLSGPGFLALVNAPQNVVTEQARRIT